MKTVLPPPRALVRSPHRELRCRSSQNEKKKKAPTTWFGQDAGRNRSRVFHPCPAREPTPGFSFCSKGLTQRDGSDASESRCLDSAPSPGGQGQPRGLQGAWEQPGLSQLLFGTGPGHTLVHSALPGIHSSVYSCCILPKQLFLTVVGLQHANCMYIRHTTKCSDYYFIKYSSISVDCLRIGGSLLNSKT